MTLEEERGEQEEENVRRKEDENDGEVATNRNKIKGVEASLLWRRFTREETSKENA